MSSHLRGRIQREVDLIQRFAGTYGRKFDELIGRMNERAGVEPAGPDEQSLRLCVEAVNMVLSLQCQLARVLAELSNDAPAKAAA